MLISRSFCNRRLAIMRVSGPSYADRHRTGMQGLPQFAAGGPLSLVEGWPASMPRRKSPKNSVSTRPPYKEFGPVGIGDFPGCAPRCRLPAFTQRNGDREQAVGRLSRKTFPNPEGDGELKSTATSSAGQATRTLMAAPRSSELRRGAKKKKKKKKARGRTRPDDFDVRKFH